MSFDLYVQRRMEEIEEKLLTFSDPVERLYIWFMFIKDFSRESHTLFDEQYEEFIKLCEQYVQTPDPVARKELSKTIKTCAREIDNFNFQLRKIPKLQTNLERSLLESE